MATREGHPALGAAPLRHRIAARASPRSPPLRGHRATDRRNRPAHGRKPVGPRSHFHDAGHLLGLGAGPRPGRRRSPRCPPRVRSDALTKGRHGHPGPFGGPTSARGSRAITQRGHCRRGAVARSVFRQSRAADEDDRGAVRPARDRCRGRHGSRTHRAVDRALRVRPGRPPPGGA
jgi:hypothetical protein